MWSSGLNREARRVAGLLSFSDSIIAVVSRGQGVAVDFVLCFLKGYRRLAQNTGILRYAQNDSAVTAYGED